MRDHSSMTLLEFLFSVGFKFTIGTVWYKNILFRLLPHHSITQSFHVLLALAVVSILFFTVVLRHWKNGWTSTACFVLPFGVYTIMTYSATFLLPIQALAVAAGAVSVVYAAALFAQKVKCTEKRARKKVYKNRFFRCVYAVSCITAAAMLTPMIPFVRKNTGTPTSAPRPKQITCRFVRLKRNLDLTFVRSLGTGT